MSNAVYPSTIRGLTFTVVKRPEFSTLIQSSSNRYELRLPQTKNPIWHWSLVYDYLKDYDIQSSLTYTDLRTLAGFFLTHNGQADDFLFSDPDDNSVGPALLTTAWQAQHVYKVGDSILDSAYHWQRVTTGGLSGSTVPAWNHAGGTTTDGSVVWTDQGLYSAAGFPNLLAQLSLDNDGAGNYYSPIQRDFGGFMEDVTDLNGSITVYANGVLQVENADYTVEGPGLALPGKSYAGRYLAWTSAPTQPITAAFNFYFRVRFESDEQDFEKFLNQLWTVGGHGSRGSGEIRLMTARPPYSPVELPCVQVSCPSFIPMPPPNPGLLRTIVGPRACSSVNGSCGGASASCSADGTSPGSGSAYRMHGSPLGDPPVAYWSNFSLPGWLDPSRVMSVWFVFAWNYKPAVKMAVGQAVMGFPFHDFSQTGTTSGIGVQGPVGGPFTAGFFSGMTANGGIAWTLDDPPGACNPCGSGGSDCFASLGMSSVCLVVDYTP
jgi:hypothetical protein